jgi:hypothetical protein
MTWYHYSRLAKNLSHAFFIRFLTTNPSSIIVKHDRILEFRRPLRSMDRGVLNSGMSLGYGNENIPLDYLPHGSLVLS